MIDGIPNRPLYFYQKDIIDSQSKRINENSCPTSLVHIWLSIV